MYIAQDLIPPIASNHNSNESPVISPRASFIQQSGGGGNRERSHSIASNHSSPQNIQQQQQQPAPQTQSAPQQKNPIRALQFSQCGLFLASGGLDGVVRIWKVKGAQVPVNARGSHNRDTDTNSIAKWDTPSRRRLWVFDPVPVREYRAHTASILCLTWSKNMFLLSSAMDNTVRLWHVSRNNCIWVFRHPDSVPSVSFHPMDDRFFLSGCLDGRIRLWNIAMHKTVKWNEMENGHLITAVNFIGKDGGIAAAGSERGICQLFKTDGLVYDTHLNVRSTRGKNSVGSKITGIEIMPTLKNNSNNNNSNLISGAASVIKSHFEDKILITTNDSRIRLYNMTDKTLERKYKGHSNTCRQIKASFSDDGKYIICGSDDFGIYIWDVEDGE
ncbi:WD40 repeat-like protein, partial [Ramicandelaber brevisporus]